MTAVSQHERRTIEPDAVTGLLGKIADWAAPSHGAHRASPDADARGHVDVLFIGAHPDDEFYNLSTLGQWHERYGLEIGVVTITRGEGGGNAEGLQEGAELGLIREVEERAAVARAGIENVFYLDKPDFWYTLSAPLTARMWDTSSTLERVVRLIRLTMPYCVVTMDPRPFDQHGGHQLSARIGIEAFLRAGDPGTFPEQLTEEGLEPWSPQRLLVQNLRFAELLGPDAVEQRRLDPATGLPVFGVWSGHLSREHHTTWAQVERDAAREYVTQGFAAFPPEVPADPRELDSDWFSVLATEDGIVEAPVREQPGLRPRYAEFRDWARRVGLPWLANDAQPEYPARPVTVVPEVGEAPVLDGIDGEGEYPGAVLPLQYWQGDHAAAVDVSASAKLSRHGDDLYVLVTVTDDRQGAVLRHDDAKRHWRTDSVEIAIDPRGDSDDTSTTFKIGIVPVTTGGGPGVGRDADNNQGPVEVTAPTVRVASRVSHPYQGYSVEARIPLAELPAAVDPDRFAINILVYDSDTDDKVGQTRLAWSPFGSPQADPYVWGTARLQGYVPPATRPTAAAPATIPTEAARSADAPGSVEQAARTGVPLAAARRVTGQAAVPVPEPPRTTAPS